MSAFERALEVGADIIETDLHSTADEHLVLAHDETGTRMAGQPVAIRDVSLAELSTWDAGWGFVGKHGGRPYAGRGHRVPTLGEALSAFPHARFNIDIKDPRPRVVSQLLAHLRAQGAESRVRLASFYTRAVTLVRARGYRGETSLSRTEFLLALLAPAGLFRRLPLTGSAAQIPVSADPQGRVRFDTERVIAKCHRAGLRVDFWTINEPEKAAELVGRGADGIITDDPAGLYAAVKGEFAPGSHPAPARR